MDNLGEGTWANSLVNCMKTDSHLIRCVLIVSAPFGEVFAIIVDEVVIVLTELKINQSL